MSDDARFARDLRRMEELVAAVEATADPAAQANLRALLQVVLDLHGRGLARILDLGGPGLTQQCAADPLVSSLLLLHDLHPQDLEARARRALELAAPALAEQGCSALLTGVTGGVVSVRLERRAHGYALGEDALRRLAEDALWELCPDAEGLELQADIAEARSDAAPLVRLRVPSAAESAA